MSKITFKKKYVKYITEYVITLVTVYFNVKCLNHCKEINIKMIHEALLKTKYFILFYYLMMHLIQFPH